MFETRFCDSLLAARNDPTSGVELMTAALFFLQKTSFFCHKSPNRTPQTAQPPIQSQDVQSESAFVANEAAVAEFHLDADLDSGRAL